MNPRVFKILNTDGTSRNGGTMQWGLPKGNSPGKWMAVTGDLEPCVNGLHLCYAKNILGWIGPAVFEAEYDGEVVDAGGKIVVRRARLVRRLRWDDRIARLFACDCAERALRRERKNGRGPDPRSWDAIRVVRLYANGEASDAELDAARDAAWDAAWAAAWDAAWAATWDAARAAAWDAAWAAETRWQTKRLMEYLDGERGQA